MSKSYNELAFTDNYMFTKVLSTEPELCRQLLELILNRKVSRLKLVEYENNKQAAYESKGIRFDVYTEDEAHTVYDVEMQAEPDGNMAKRSRYYLSVMDMEQLQKGESYEKLKKSIVIFICKEKIADGYDKPVYTFRYQSQEDKTKYLEDDTLTVFVNAECSKDGVSKEMNVFLEYIRTGKITGTSESLAMRIDGVVREAKRSGRWSAEYMRWEDELNHRYYLGHEAGIEEGIKKGIQQGIRQGKAEEKARVAAEITELKARIEALEKEK